LTEFLKALFEQNNLEKYFAGTDFSQCMIENNGKVWEYEGRKRSENKCPAAQQLMSMLASTENPQELLDDIMKM